MPTIDELANAPKVDADFMPVEEAEVVEPKRVLNLDFLKAETGEGEIEDYLTHPLNFGRSRGLAQVLRGLTGMIGSLKYALIDIVIGGLNFSKERKLANVPKQFTDFNS